MDRAKCTTLIKVSLINLHSFAFFEDINLGLHTKSSTFLGTPWTATDNIKNLQTFQSIKFFGIITSDYRQGYRENGMDVKF